MKFSNKLPKALREIAQHQVPDQWLDARIVFQIKSKDNSVLVDRIVLRKKVRKSGGGLLLESFGPTVKP